MRRLDVEFKAASVAVIANVALNYFLIPIWGINGAALASLLSMIMMFAVITYYSRKIFNFSLPKDIYRPLIAGVVLLLVILVLKDGILLMMDWFAFGVQSIVLQGELAGALLDKASQALLFGLLFLLAGFIYFVLLLLFRAFGKEETTVLESGLRRINLKEGHVRPIMNFFEKFS
jgi:stage V sporulation protein B